MTTDEDGTGTQQVTVGSVESSFAPVIFAFGSIICVAALVQGNVGGAAVGFGVVIVQTLALAAAEIYFEG